MEPRDSANDSSSAGDPSSNSAVHVAVRVRPLSATECAQGSEPCVSALGDTSVLVGGLSGKQFDFDAVFAPQIDQREVYAALIAPLVDRFFDGYNATVFAYGQTGSGKTFTMGNEFKLTVAEADRGIIPRTMDEIFQRIAKAPPTNQFTLKLSYLQILNEEIHDLLTPTSATGSLTVRDDGKRGVYVHGLSEHRVDALDHVASLLHAGALSRATASTTMNAQSSRSHAICTLLMEQHDTTTAQTTFAKFHLVDLAGSERAKRTNAEGARFKEGVNINRGLLSLGNVINALAEKSAHVPYRDSKLTRLLQDSLGGNSKTLMIACVSPADVNFEETCNTLRYAARARNIQNVAVVNQTLSAEGQVAFLKQQLESLQLQLLQQSTQSITQGSSSHTGAVVSPVQVESMEKEIARWRSIAKTREEELQLVMSAKNKWKKIADEFMATKQAGKPGTVRAATSESYSPARKALLQDAIEFDRSVHVALLPSTPAKQQQQQETSKTTEAEDKDALRREQSLTTVQFKRQEQRKQFELQRLTAVHAQQQHGTIKRKPEEAATASKKMRTSQQPLQRGPVSGKKPVMVMVTGRVSSSSAAAGVESEMEAVSKTLKEVLEVQSTIVGAKKAIEWELEDRRRLALELSQLEAMEDEAKTEKLAALRAALREKNADIRLLQQKLASVEKSNARPSALFPASVSVCHQLIRQLMDTVVDSTAAAVELETCKRALAAAEEQLADHAILHEDTVAAYQRRLHALGDSAPVLVPVVTASQRGQELEMVKRELETATRELERVRSTLSMVAKVTAPSPLPKPKKKAKEEEVEVEEDEELLSSSDEEDEEEEDDDSDYTEDEGAKRKRARVRQPLQPTTSANAMDEIDLLLARPSICCSCSGKCATRSCACRADKQKCGASCECKATKCHNRPGFVPKKKRKTTASDKENEVEAFFVVAADKPASP